MINLRNVQGLRCGRAAPFTRQKLEARTRRSELAPSPADVRTWRRGGGIAAQAPGAHTPAGTMQPASPARPRTGGLATAPARPAPRLTACVQPTGGPRGRPRGVGPVLRKGLFPGPSPAPAGPAPPRPSGPASYLHGPDQAPAGQLALPQLQQNVDGPRPAAPSAPGRRRCRSPSPSAGPRPSRRRRRRHVSSSDKQEASGPRAAEISTGRQRGRRSAPTGPSVEAQAAWQGTVRAAEAAGKCSLGVRWGRCAENLAAFVVFRAPGCDISVARTPRSRTSPACALSHFLSVLGRYSQLVRGKIWAPGQESSFL